MDSDQTPSRERNTVTLLKQALQLGDIRADFRWSDARRARVEQRLRGKAERMVVTERYVPYGGASRHAGPFYTSMKNLEMERDLNLSLEVWGVRARKNYLAFCIPNTNIKYNSKKQCRHSWINAIVLRTLTTNMGTNVAGWHLTYLPPPPTSDMIMRRDDHSRHDARVGLVYTQGDDSSSILQPNYRGTVPPC
ncbi:hypothetical protein AaE_014469 [Aphanomyces astaci]|uniref:Uncharacterized protein n=1 Tax=Aphanomyces astaci TaxID=112090 RepID=A0A6A4Z6A1_APHAT|nr:hypothetical protein AaE_014469 [Aphanomyces astaci]